MMENDDQTGYKWETAYTEGLNIHAVLQEDETGSIEASVRKIVQEAKQKRRNVEKHSHVRLGIMRYVYIILDFSYSMLNQSLYPTRMQVAMSCINIFLDKFFEQNPLSQLGIIICRDKRAERIIGFSSSPQQIKESLANVSVASCCGEFSLESSLQMAASGFYGLPGHSSKEIILFVSSLVSIDAGNVLSMFEILKTRRIRCSVIGLSAEVYVYKKLSTTTNGSYSVVLDKTHFEILLNDHVQPPVASKEQEASIVKMGFPKRCAIDAPSFCMCHDQSNSGLFSIGCESGGNPNVTRAFYCPQCLSRYCQTPVECRVCGLLLLTAPQLARAQQHLQPLSAFREDQCAKDQRLSCYGCDQLLTNGQNYYSCKKCEEPFCIDCDILLHESLQICPSCE